MRKLRYSFVFLLFCAGTLALSDRANADEPSAADIERARPHYERGVKLYEAGDYDAARAELERAYAIAPSYRILYNLGQIQLKKSDYVGALRNFQLYLEEAGSAIPEVRKTQVQAEIDKLNALVATVTVETNVPGSDILVDDVIVGKTPLARPILVNPGRRKIGASHGGKIPAAKVIEVVGRDAVNLKLDLHDTMRVVVVDKPTRRVPWVGWGATVALAAGAGVTGYVALNASNSLTDMRDATGADPDRLETYSSRAKTFGLISDIATIGAVIAGGVSLYYTLKWGAAYSREMDQWEEQRQQAEPPKAAGVKVRWSPTGVVGTF